MQDKPWVTVKWTTEVLELDSSAHPKKVKITEEREIISDKEAKGLIVEARVGQGIQSMRVRALVPGEKSELFPGEKVAKELTKKLVGMEEKIRPIRDIHPSDIVEKTSPPEGVELRVVEDVVAVQAMPLGFLDIGRPKEPLDG